MSIRHYAFGNLGRDKGPKSSNKMDMDALMALRVNVPDEECCIQLCEINEGDDNNELKAALTVFRGWRVYGKKTREPILLSPDQPPAKARVIWVPNTAVRSWSPPRSVLIVNLADEPESIIGFHPAAGANGQGDRPSWARKPLQTSFDLLMDRVVRVKRGLHRRGRNVTSQFDGNAYKKETARIQPGERVVWHDATDWGTVWPAKGYGSRFHDAGKVDFKIDSHDGHTMWGRYVKI